MHQSIPVQSSELYSSNTQSSDLYSSHIQSAEFHSSDIHLSDIHSSSSSIAERLHGQAIKIAGDYKRAEADLLDLLPQIERHRVFLRKGHSSLFQYVVSELGLSESVAYNLISVSRKAAEVPALREKIQNGKITLSNARKIVPVLTPENQADWLDKASTLSQRQLEKEIAKERPESATPEKANYTSGDRVRLELGLSEKDMLKLRRVQDLLSQSRRRAVTLEDVLVAMTEEYLHRHDPLARAKRQKVRTGLKGKNDLKPVPQPNPEPSDESPTEKVETPVALPKTHADPRAPPS